MQGRWPMSAAGQDGLPSESWVERWHKFVYRQMKESVVIGRPLANDPPCRKMEA